jgi:hypothetical protein
MKSTIGWTLAAAGLVTGWLRYGWPGATLALSIIVFWLLLVFNRSIKVMRVAAQSPVGEVASAVMLNAKLSVGMPMLDIVAFTKSLGRRVSEEGETWVWTDSSGSQVAIAFHKGRCRSWVLDRPETPG